MQAKSCARASEPRDETYCDDIVPLGKLESVNAEGRGGPLRLNPSVLLMPH